MTDMLAARIQMAMSLGFHVIFAALGIAMSLLMSAAESAMWIPMATCTLFNSCLPVWCAGPRGVTFAAVMPSALKNA
jgi:hypothetical protein